ncbi:MAG: nucleoid-associated protein, partial [Eggerthella lenta]
ENRWLIPDGLLQCSMEASSKEVFDAVTRIVEEVAEEYGANAAVAVSKAKAYVAENADESDELAPWDLGEEVFEDEPLQKRFEQALADEALPERVVVEKNVAKRVAKSHKIRTDTGIDITFPAEYGENPDFIEFVSGTERPHQHRAQEHRPHREPLEARGPILQPAAAPASPWARRMRQ